MLTIFIAASTAVIVLVVGAKLTTVGEWYKNLIKPRWNPPDWIFGPAWTVILGLAACAGVLSWNNAYQWNEKLLVLTLFAINIFFHVLWSPLFFNLRRPDWALVEIPFLWLSIVGLIIGLAPISSVASYLLLPYLLWVSFATFLNWKIVKLNAPFQNAR